MRSLTLFDFAKPSADSVISLTIAGGSVNLRSLRSLPLFNGKNDKRIIFSKNESGSRTAFKLTDDKIPDMIFNTDEGERALKFVKRERVHFTRYMHYTISY